MEKFKSWNSWIYQEMNPEDKKILRMHMRRKFPIELRRELKAIDLTNLLKGKNVNRINQFFNL